MVIDINGTTQSGHNHLSGSIPSGVGNFVSMTDLDLSVNNLTGNIPSGFANFNALVNIDLHSNNLQGDMLILTTGIIVHQLIFQTMH